MGVVSTILAWVYRYQNGGFLNLLFKPTSNDTGVQNFVFKKPTMGEVTGFFKAVLLGDGSAMPLEVLKVLPEQLGGGLEGIKNATENPNREGVFMIAPLVILILMIIAILGLLIINLGCCCCRCCC